MYIFNIITFFILLSVNCGSMLAILNIMYTIMA